MLSQVCPQRGGNYNIVAEHSFHASGQAQSSATDDGGNCNISWRFTELHAVGNAPAEPCVASTLYQSPTREVGHHDSDTSDQVPGMCYNMEVAIEDV
jgi:hypothetical protein